MKYLYKIFVIFLIIIELSLILVSIFFEFEKEKNKPEIYFLDSKEAWADTLLKRMSIEEKIGQLFFLEINDAKNEDIQIYDSIIQSFKPGGIKFCQTKVLQQLIISNFLQAKSKHPLLISSEGSLINYQDFNLPIGPIINSSENIEFTNYYLGQLADVLNLQDVNIYFSVSTESIDSIGKGNGFSSSDSINNLLIESFRKKLHNKQVINCLNFEDELFLRIGSNKADSLKIPESKYKADKFFAIQINNKISELIGLNSEYQSIAQYLKRRFLFKGLIFSNTEVNQADKIIKLFDSGIDVFIVKELSNQHISNIKQLLTSGLIKEEEINKRVKRILMAKTWAGLEKQNFKSAENSLSKIYGNQRKLLAWKIYENSICLLKNKGNLLPFANLINNRCLILSTGNENTSFFSEILNNYMDISNSQIIKKDFKPTGYSSYSNIILLISNSDSVLLDNKSFLSNIQKLEQQHNLIIVNFGNQGALKTFDFADAIIYAFDVHPLSQTIAAQVITGSFEPKGNLNAFQIKKQSGKVSFKKNSRLQYTIPETAGFNSIELEELDRLIYSAINRHAMPGCQVLAAKDGKVFYNKSFGNLGYGNFARVNNDILYDIASISKVASTTLASMKLFEMGKLGLNDSIKYYIDDTVNCTIKNHQLRDFFLHKSGLQPDMPILQYIRYKNKVTKRFDKYYSEKEDTSYSIKVADHYYLRNDYLDSIRYSLYKLAWDSTKMYNYSDINFNIIYDVNLRKIEGNYSDYLFSNFYNPLQLRTIGFNPLERFKKSRIAPTQEDKFWRKQLLIGYPHDESAALYGGISGNAGLFSNANDLAILFQMLLNGGNYGGRQILKKETIELFTSAQDDSPRGLGFARSKSGQFGHTGFTGCVVWANPESKMIFVFLSNSIHPNVMNKKLKNMEIREKAYDLIMKAYEPGSGDLKIGE